jgi:hypothetical protein
MIFLIIIVVKLLNPNSMASDDFHGATLSSPPLLESTSVGVDNFPPQFKQISQRVPFFKSSLFLWLLESWFRVAWIPQCFLPLKPCRVLEKSSTTLPLLQYSLALERKEKGSYQNRLFGSTILRLQLKYFWINIQHYTFNALSTNVLYLWWFIKHETMLSIDILYMPHTRVHGDLVPCDPLCTTGSQHNNSKHLLLVEICRYLLALENVGGSPLSWESLATRNFFFCELW